MDAARTDRLTCYQCSHIQTLAPTAAGGTISCEKCHLQLRADRPRWLEHATAYTVTAAVLFLASISFPFLALDSALMRQEATIISGVAALMDRSQWLLAALVLITILLMPLMEILGFLYLLIPFRMRRRLPMQISVFRWLVVIQPWSMLEIFALATLVTLVKLSGTASIIPGVAMYAFFLLVLALLGAYIAIDRRQMWTWLYPYNYFRRVEDEPMYRCGVCEALVGRSIVRGKERCPRCHSHIHERLPYSFQKTAALVLAAAILYIPANILPMMSYTAFGVTRTDTIFTGVVALISDGLWWVAVVVFVASILVPITKLVVLTYLLWSVKTGVAAGARHRQGLFRAIEVIGRWSMVDVFVVTLLVALVQFGVFGQVEPRGAIVAFGGVVVLTMLATQTFDPRLLWDAQANTKADQTVQRNESR